MTGQEKDSIFDTSIGEVVKGWRTIRKLTITELAQRSGAPITKGYISQLENNKVRQPGDDHLVRIAAALDIPVLYLVTRRLPSQSSTDGLKGIEDKADSQQLASSLPIEEEPSSTARTEVGGFTFGSPLPSSRRKQMQEEEELRQILAQLDEMRSRIKKLIAQKGR